MNYGLILTILIRTGWVPTGRHGLNNTYFGISIVKETRQQHQSQICQVQIRQFLKLKPHMGGMWAQIQLNYYTQRIEMLTDFGLLQ
jgi:hypothetical protein